MSDTITHKLYTELKGSIAQAELSVPSKPDTTEALKAISDNPQSTADEAVSAIVSDPAVTSQILSFANSPYVRVSDAITDVGDALERLGFEYTVSLAHGASASQTMTFHSKVIKSHIMNQWQVTRAHQEAMRFLIQSFGLSDKKMALATLSCVGALSVLRFIDEDPGYRLLYDYLDGDRSVISQLSASVGDRLLEEWGIEFDADDLLSAADSGCRTQSVDVALLQACKWLITQADQKEGSDHGYTPRCMDSVVNGGFDHLMYIAPHFSLSDTKTPLAQ